MSKIAASNDRRRKIREILQASRRRPAFKRELSGISARVLYSGDEEEYDRQLNELHQEVLDDVNPHRRGEIPYDELDKDS